MSAQTHGVVNLSITASAISALHTALRKKMWRLPTWLTAELCGPHWASHGSRRIRRKTDVQTSTWLIPAWGLNFREGKTQTHLHYNRSEQTYWENITQFKIPLPSLTLSLNLKPSLCPLVSPLPLVAVDQASDTTVQPYCPVTLHTSPSSLGLRILTCAVNGYAGEFVQCKDWALGCHLHHHHHHEIVGKHTD